MVGSILLVLVSTGLLVVGLVRGSDILYYGSIVASVLAALALVVAVRRLPGAQAADEDFDVRPGAPRLGAGAMVGAAAVFARPVGRAGVPRQARVEAAGSDQYPGADVDESVPVDEPSEQEVSSSDAARVATLDTEVLVIDGRPRYHVPECLHLLGREYERLPVCEAVELGFTPCGQCEPNRVLLAGAPRK